MKRSANYKWTMFEENLYAYNSFHHKNKILPVWVTNSNYVYMYLVKLSVKKWDIKIVLAS